MNFSTFTLNSHKILKTIFLKKRLISGISYIAHPQANPTRVTDFKNIEKITTSILQTQTIEQNQQKSDKDMNKTDIESVKTKLSEDRTTNSCACNETKTLLKIKVIGNSDDLTITCNGAKTADSIADLVDGYCRMTSNVEISFWDRASTNTMQKFNTSFISQDDLPKHLEQFQQACSLSQLSTMENAKTEDCKDQFNN